MQRDRNTRRQTNKLVPSSALEALPALPALDLVPVTLLVFALARKATASSFSLSFISIFFSNFQSPMFLSMSFFRPPSPAPASFPACFERGVAAPAISALAVATSVCRESQRMRVIMLSDPGPGLERTSTAVTGRGLDPQDLTQRGLAE